MIMKLLVTGAAGFIGFHTVKALLDKTIDTATLPLSPGNDDPVEVVGLDVINDYYDLRVKYGRLEQCGIAMQHIRTNESVPGERYPDYRFVKMNLTDQQQLYRLFEQEQFDVVIHLAAQAGVRYSISHPDVYLESNVIGFFNILEACRHNAVKHLVYASSSSVYGWNERMPFSTSDNVDHPISLYAASKKSNELLAHSYSALYDLPTTGLRFFTVYGPWGRPDMALFLFTEKILADEPIDVYNRGEMRRDFTYVDDIVEGVVRVAFHPPTPNPDWRGDDPDPSSSRAPYKVYNIGNNQPVRLMEFIQALEQTLGKTAQKNLLPLQPGDVPASHADVSDLVRDIGYQPGTDVHTGIERFVEWYLGFYGQRGLGDWETGRLGD